MTRNMRYGCVGGLVLLSVLLPGCSSDQGTDVEATATCQFDIRTRGGDASGTDSGNQYTRLYVAERLQEHDEDHLHCAVDRRYTLTGGTYALTDLYGQWYKFAFVCVPQWDGGGGADLLTEENPVERTCDYNKLLVDFDPVLAYQKTNVNIAQTVDLNVYRRVIDRWIDPEATNTEDVEMVRMTGELHLDMGIPADQFEKDVKSITLTLTTPVAKAYVRDGANDVVTTVAGTTDVVYTLDFSKLTGEAYTTAMATRQVFRLCLLPEVLKGNINVTFKNSNQSVTLPIGTDTDDGETLVEVRKNRVTTVLYNGMEANEFEVRYAGFATGTDDAAVDVADDTWNGW